MPRADITVDLQQNIANVLKDANAIGQRAAEKALSGELSLSDSEALRNASHCQWVRIQGATEARRVATV